MKVQRMLAADNKVGDESGQQVRLATTSPANRFWQSTSPANECWRWTREVSEQMLAVYVYKRGFVKKQSVDNSKLTIEERT
jgi:hypothetical protein